MRIVGARLRELRREHDMTQGDIASSLKTDPTSISHIEAGRRDLRVSQLVKLAKRFGVKVVDIVGVLDQRHAA